MKYLLTDDDAANVRRVWVTADTSLSVSQASAALGPAVSLRMAYLGVRRWLEAGYLVEDGRKARSVRGVRPMYYRPHPRVFEVATSGPQA